MTMTWDEPARASTPRGWLKIDGTCVGFYLDYGDDHYRSPHTYDRGDMIITFCNETDPCRDHQPGNILCVRYPNGPGTSPHDSRYVETIDEARAWVEAGRSCGYCGNVADAIITTDSPGDLEPPHPDRLVTQVGMATCELHRQHAEHHGFATTGIGGSQ